jgi:ATP-dependent Lhr-like helicase
LLAEKTFVPAPPNEQLRGALELLKDREFPPEAWENSLLPARVNAYRPQMLDALLSEGSFYWRFSGDKSKSLSFHAYEASDWDADLTVNDNLDKDARIILNFLINRGAVFSSALTAPLEGRPAYDALQELMTQGYIHADSFTPVRQWLERSKMEKYTTRQKVNARIQTLNSGRWDISRPVRELPLKEAILRSFDKYAVLCRETARELGLPWAECLESLRVMEYTGVVRRGYFVEGLSGAQYVRSEDYGFVVAELEAPARELRWLTATDPYQPWGRILKHLPGREFMLVHGTYAALYEGLPIAVFERSGAVLRIFDEEHDQIPTALRRFAADYTARRCYPCEKRLVVKSYPAGIENALADAGFSRVMDDFVLRQGIN